MVAHCRSCGRWVTLRWPRGAPECCSQRCAAEHFLIYAGAGNWEAAHCPDCGEPDPDCTCEEDSND